MHKKILVSIAIFIKDINEFGFSLWTQVRDEEGPLYGRLEFPGGKIEPGETPKEAAIREVQEEVGVDISNANPQLFKIQNYEFNNKYIVLYVYVMRFDQLPKDHGHWLNVNYTDKSEPFKGKIPEINHVFIDELAVYIQKLQTNNLVDLTWTILK